MPHQLLNVPPNSQNPRVSCYFYPSVSWRKQGSSLAFWGRARVFHTSQFVRFVGGNLFRISILGVFSCIFSEFEGSRKISPSIVHLYPDVKQGSFSRGAGGGRAASAGFFHTSQFVRILGNLISNINAGCFLMHFLIISLKRSSRISRHAAAKRRTCYIAWSRGLLALILCPETSKICGFFYTKLLQ